jgi:AcrR family transcriptional regulator/DNA-binding MarR family transcriptional regulator
VVGDSAPAGSETDPSTSRFHGLSRGQVTEVQRARLLAAAVDTITEIGYSRMTVAQVISRARVSRKTFYDVFADREDCFLAAFEQTHSQAWRAASDACDPESAWRERVRSGLGRLLMLVEEEPGLARLWIVEALGAGQRVLARRAEALDEFAKVIHRGRFAAKGERQPPELAALGVVGGVCTVLHARLLNDADGPATDLLNSLMSIIVLPYLGSRAAGRELNRPPFQIRSDGRPRRPARANDPLEGLEMRLTYRTVRVLTVIARHPGWSNRGIAEASGVHDDGQISKLLHRLARLNLIENSGAGQERGVANVWYLTPRGVRLERAARSRDMP